MADAFCGVRCGNFDHTESDANAELIALAPELAEAVLALVDPEGYTPLIAGRPMQHSLRALAARLRQIGAGT